ncbi:hypothetical protein KVR01_004377 [Diaporthe batatas]|uniref:uncharacterized protein n=1 Tax=Diaporthe batatas TaxID=748121 RepID=UPI001D046455|nr:uncharacterized protein KVR01_004377 [Diaporthe batatas]KAG8165825.1 hypothetical protein KVR01_004377 [Diaporthe batatas]
METRRRDLVVSQDRQLHMSFDETLIQGQRLQISPQRMLHPDQSRLWEPLEPSWDLDTTTTTNRSLRIQRSQVPKSSSSTHDCQDGFPPRPLARRPAWPGLACPPPIHHLSPAGRRFEQCSALKSLTDACLIHLPIKPRPHAWTDGARLAA